MTRLEERALESIIQLNKKIPDMTLRDYFAGQALAGIMVNIKDDFGNNPYECISTICYDYADAMIKRRKEN